jgi:hypothetical protein
MRFLWAYFAVYFAMLLASHALILESGINESLSAAEVRKFSGQAIRLLISNLEGQNSPVNKHLCRPFARKSHIAWLCPFNSYPHS